METSLIPLKAALPTHCPCYSLFVKLLLMAEPCYGKAKRSYSVCESPLCLSIAALPTHCPCYSLCMKLLFAFP